MTRTRSFWVSTSRSAGAVDRRDVIIGGVLLFSIPIIFGFVGPKPKDDPFAFGKRPNIVAEPDQEEVEARWKIAEQAYQTNAKAFVKNATETEDGTLKEYFRRWAMRSLTCASSAAADVTNLLNDEKFPEAKTRFAPYLAKVEVLKKQIEMDVARVKKLDVLGRDAK
jgi:hypothetical protein